MRFIGSKKNLLTQIDAILQPHLDGSEKSFVDLFAGSNAVGEHFADRYQIFSNDLMYFSYVLARGGLGIRRTPRFTDLRARGIADPLQFLSSQSLADYAGDYVTEEYSPAGAAQRMYFTEENANRIDFCRNTIEDWRREGWINDDEYYYLLAALIAAIPFVSNTTGTYGAYLKKWDKRAFKELTLTAQPINNRYRNQAHNADSLALVTQLTTSDIIYIDTPYNSRQYPANYHVLETIARWDKPALKGVTGQPNLDAEKSDFAVKRKALDAMTRLINQTTAKHVVVSYSTDGIIPEDQLLGLMQGAAKDHQVTVHKIDYRKYKGKLHNNNKVQELLFYYQPKRFKEYQQVALFSTEDFPAPRREEVAPKGFIKSPLNYIGGKYKLLPQIFPYFPARVNTFIDLFSGGANVGINVPAKQVVFNDLNFKINELFRYLQAHNVDAVINQITGYIDQYQLSKTNAAGFKKFRDAYNRHPNPVALYTLVAYSFNYQFRFNNQLQYNNPFGRNRSHFSKQMRTNLINFAHRLHSIDATFTDHYFTELDFSALGKDDFVYADPPYLITTGSYNDGNRGFVNWTEEQDHELRDLLDSLDQQGVRFALSNVLEHKGTVNHQLVAWSKQYHVHHLNYSYSNSSHNTSHTGSDEVLITNY